MQDALRTERDSLQQQLTQAKLDLEAARAAPSGTATDASSTGAVTDAERTELEQKAKKATEDLTALQAVSIAFLRSGGVR